MTREELFGAIGDVREAWIADAGEENVRRTTRARRAGRFARRAGAIAACLAIVLTVGYRFVCWYFPMGGYEQVLRIKPIVLHGRLMSYAMERLGEGQQMLLAARLGDVVWENGETTVWKLKGREDYAELIFSDGDTYQLGRLEDYSALPEGWNFELENYINWWYAPLLTPEEWRQIDTSAYTFAEVLREIYCVDSADDIAWVRFEKSGIDNTEVGRSVKVKTVTLRDTDEIAQVWDILWSLTPTDHYADRPQPTVPKPDDVKSVQIVRDVTVTFKNGSALRFEYDPAGGEDCALFYRLEGVNYYYLTVEQNHTLIDLAGISFAPTPIPETDPPQGIAETATAAPVPETTPE